jgi:hypothetical protein
MALLVGDDFDTTTLDLLNATRDIIIIVSRKAVRAALTRCTNS